MGLKISVIIPIYNVEDYLEECIDSVIEQSYKNLEIILINDGSKDNSGMICDAYALNDKRIKVIHKENGGLSDARNNGVKAATGDYIMFLDSDDYWDGKDVISNIVNNLNQTKADILVFGYKKYFEEDNFFIDASSIGDREKITGQSKKNAFSYLMQQNLYISSACSKIIKRKLLDNLYFEKGATSEDIEWSARLAIKAEKFDYYNENFYIYRQRSGSITKTMTIDNIKRLQKNIDLCIKYGEEIKDTSFFKPYMEYVAYQYMTLIANAFKLNKYDNNKVIAKIKGNSYLLQYGKNRKVKIVYLAKKLLGFKAMNNILKRFYIAK